MRPNAQNKENFAPKEPSTASITPVVDRIESTDVENGDGFVEIDLGSADDQIASRPTSNLNPNRSATAKKVAENDKGLELTGEDDGGDTDEEEMEVLGSDDSSADLGAVGLEELLEIEKELPDDLGAPQPPARPYTPFENRSSRSQGPLLSQIYPPGLDPKALPAPLQLRKSSYFSKDNPIQTDSEFDEDDEGEDNWFEEGEIEDDGIRRDEVEMSFAEWRLNRHPRFGKYRVKEISCLRVCQTIETDAPSKKT